MSDPTQTSGSQPATRAPENISQEAIDAAIAHVEKLGNTDGLSPDVLQAACRQLEAQARAKGVKLEPGIPPQDDKPTNTIESAVMDKKGALDAFHQQRDTLKSAVAQQLKATQAPYAKALQKAYGGNAESSDGVDGETMIQLANAVRALDPETITMINVLGILAADPSVLNSIVWLEIIHTLRNRISARTRTHAKEQ